MLGPSLKLDGVLKHGFGQKMSDRRGLILNYKEVDCFFVLVLTVVIYYWKMG